MGVSQIEQQSNNDLTGIRGSFLHFPNVTSSPETDAVHIPDGLMVLRGEKIHDIGHYADLLTKYPQLNIQDFTGKLIIPGLIDTHIHFPQTEIIASYGEQLLEWLQNYTFPTERKFADPAYASFIAEQFLQQLWSNGTTTAMAYATVHSCSADALFSAASKVNMAMLTGKVCMDRNSPEWLSDSAEDAYQDSANLIDKWHNQGRAKYVITPRFAPTSTPEQLQRLGELAKAYPDVFIQTHLSENQDEIDWVQSLYPNSRDYLDVYEHYGLVNNRSIFGHCIHLNERTWRSLADHQAIIAFCPRSNTFLGSGLFDLATAEKYNVPVTIASDVGGGDSFNMLRTQGEAYKVCQLQGYTLHPYKGLYMMTQGSAATLGLDTDIGNLNANTTADFVVLDPEFSPLTKLRMQSRAATPASSPDDIVFALSMLGDERAIHSTWIAGKAVYKATQQEMKHGVA